MISGSKNQKRMRPAEAVRSVADGHGITFLHIGRGKLFRSNEVGLMIWVGLEHGLTPEGIVEGLQRHYGIPRPQAASDVARFLEVLEQAGLAVGHGSAACC
jgi:hypothetical protein